MTFEEARKILERELLAVTLESNVSKKETQKKRLNEKFKALNVALEAIDKQIPKKPIRLPANHPFYYEAGDCPTCGVSVYVSDGKICSQCGQKIDWSDTDD